MDGRAAVGNLGIGELAPLHARWLMARQNAISTNIAHASSPGYRAVDVKPFAEVLERSDLAIAGTDAAHIQTVEYSRRQIGKSSARVTDVSHSGNTVSLDRQMVMANEVRQGYALNTSVVKSFHRLLLSAVRS